MNKEIHVYISGKVQGVWYRASTQKKATDLRLVGWVRNLADGRVELIAQGEEKQLNSLLTWCRQGPELAKVTEVEVIWREAIESFDNFITRPTFDCSRK